MAQPRVELGSLHYSPGSSAPSEHQARTDIRGGSLPLDYRAFDVGNGDSVCDIYSLGWWRWAYEEVKHRAASLFTRLRGGLFSPI